MSTSSNMAKWTADLRKMLIDICIGIKFEGGFCDSGFKGEQWHKIVTPMPIRLSRCIMQI
jgi:hypothetical protein